MGAVCRRGLRAALVSTVVMVVVGCSAQPPPEGAVATGSSTRPVSPVEATAPPEATPPADTGPPTTEPSPPDSPSPPGSPSPDDSQPPEFDWVPPEEEIDRMAIEAEAAYRAHLAAYDAAALTGFTDPALLEDLLATAGGNTLESLRLQADVLAGTGRTVHGDSEVLRMEPIGLDPPVPGGWGISVGFDACVIIAGVVLEADGTVARLLDREAPQFVRVMVADDDGDWLVVSQLGIEGPCPADFLGEDG